MTSTKIEFAEWNTPFKDNECWVFDVQYGDGGLRADFHDVRKGFRIAPTRQAGEKSVTVRVFEHVTFNEYRIYAESCRVFRVLDEGDLAELWVQSSEAPGPAQTTFRVRGHSWAKDNEATFFVNTTDGWSYIIATGWECVELLCREEPKVTFVTKHEPLPYFPTIEDNDD